MPDVQYPFIMANEVVHCKESHPLLLKCFKALLGYHSQVGEASDGIYPPHMGHMGPWPPGFIIQNPGKSRILSTLSSWQMRWYVARRAIYCC